MWLNHTAANVTGSQPRRVSRRPSWTNGDGTVTWRWREDDPTATYLTTATVGDFTYTDKSMTETSTVPLSLQAAGLDLGGVMESLVRAAVARSAGH